MRNIFLQNYTQPFFKNRNWIYHLFALIISLHNMFFKAAYSFSVYVLCFSLINLINSRKWWFLLHFWSTRQSDKIIRSSQLYKNLDVARENPFFFLVLCKFSIWCVISPGYLCVWGSGQWWDPVCLLPNWQNLHHRRDQLCA